jgi:hypothetical protein
MSKLPVGRYIISFEVYEEELAGDFEMEILSEDIPSVPVDLQQQIEKAIFSLV